MSYQSEIEVFEKWEKTMYLPDEELCMVQKITRTPRSTSKKIT
jgi:hypothetical protein